MSAIVTVEVVVVLAELFRNKEAARAIRKYKDLEEKNQDLAEEVRRLKEERGQKP